MSGMYFNRRVYTLRLFLKDVFFIISNIFELNKLRKNKEINKVFQEKIMTIVSSINGCVYCKWFHAKQAVKAGIPSESVKKLLKLQFNTIAYDYELKGLLFAQHFTETNRAPDKDMIEDLYSFYGKKNAKHIILTIRMIYFGNLYGNTLDAFVSRMQGKKAQHSSFLFEFIFFMNNLPIYAILRLSLKK